MSLSAIVALTKQNGMSKDGKIPWRVPEDFKYFKNYTTNKVCVMGRHTYEDLLTYAKNKNDPLPNRKIVVITNGVLKNKNISTSKNLLDCVNRVDRDLDICFIGGKRIYEESAKLFNNFDIELSVTRLDFGHLVECDTFFNPEENGYFLHNECPLNGTPHTIQIYRNRI